jgi:predicted TIM-barrel fold metal-dependent hydrolase
LLHNPDALHDVFHAFNEWMHDDWTFNYQDRIYAAPYVSLLDVDWAIAELEYALAHDARVILMRPGSVHGAERRRSPGDPEHDAFWARLNEAGVTLVVHGGDSGYQPYQQLWGLTGETEAFRHPTLSRLLSASPIHDMVASLLADRLFERFSNLRVATIETGSGWVKPLLKRLQKVVVQAPTAFGADPHELFMEHVWVSPFFEDDVMGLIDVVGTDRVVFGSDWPHAEGLADPTSFIKEIDTVSDADAKKIMHDNARQLVTPRSA